MRIDWTGYDAEVGPFLDGTAIPGGARWTAVELREPGGLSRAQRRSYRHQWQEHFRQRGWLDRLFRYVQDEPAVKDFPQVEERARQMRDDAPEVRRLVTTAWTDRLPDVDLWTPVLNALFFTFVFNVGDAIGLPIGLASQGRGLYQFWGSLL